MPDSLDVVVLEVPGRVADLAFRIAVPRDWNVLELPGEDVDFSVPGNFFPLLLAVAPWAAVALTVAGRPGFEEGTLQDWSLFLLDSLGIRPTAFGPATIGNVRGLAGVGRQEQEGTWLEVRFAFFEDGGRLVHLGLLAPEAISAPLESVWQAALAGFVLERPQGQTAEVGPGMGISPERVAEKEIAVPPVEIETPAPVALPEPEVDEPVVEQAPAKFPENELGYYAKSADTTTLDPEHPVNARLRNQGVGLTPNLLDVDLEGRTAKLGAGAIGALIRVALGWHVIDDGRRTMVLDPDGKIQINLSVIPKEGRSIDQILDAIQAEATESYADPEFLRVQNGDMWGLMIRGIVVNEEPVEQVHMLTPWAQDSAMLRARVTADPESSYYAANFAELILRSVDYGDRSSEQEEESSDSGQPEWMQRALELERADRLEEAEQLIRASVPSLHFAIVIADLYRRRWIRLRESDPAKAREARQQAADWAYNYASYATSGGEGEALSLERDEFLRQLGPEPLEP